MQTHQWQYQRRGEREFILGGQTIALDAEGFFVDAPHPRFDDKLRSLEKRGIVKLVALDNDALWQERLERASAHVAEAEAKAAQIERGFVRAHDFVRVCKDQRRELKAEWDRYRALIPGVSEAAAKAVEHAEIATPATTPTTELSQKASEQKAATAPQDQPKSTKKG